MTAFTLASSSPRRRQLCARLGVDFDVVATEADETPRAAEPAHELVTRLAIAKALAAHDGSAPVLGADTTIALVGRTLGKPADIDEARDMLERLAGRAHDVVSGVAVVAADRTIGVDAVTATVHMAEIDDRIDWYLATDEWRGKAGAYAIQGCGDLLIERIDGAVSTVIGLPLRRTAELLIDAGVPLW